VAPVIHKKRRLNMNGRENNKRAEQLGMPIGTASNRLRKMILFSLIQELHRNICFRCSKPIENIDDFSIEHKIAWLDSENPIGLFFDLNNISFSHMSCNSGAGRRKEAGPLKHGTHYGYQQGCRCLECKTAKSTIDSKYTWDRRSIWKR